MVGKTKIESSSMVPFTTDEADECSDLILVFFI